MAESRQIIHVDMDAFWVYLYFVGKTGTKIAFHCSKTTLLNYNERQNKCMKILSHN